MDGLLGCVHLHIHAKNLPAIKIRQIAPNPNFLAEMDNERMNGDPDNHFDPIIVIQ